MLNFKAFVKNSYFKDPESYGCVMGEYLHNEIINYKESNKINCEVANDILIISLNDIEYNKQQEKGVSQRLNKND